nr:hypothetical protein [Nanoarchaeum sp.]
MEIISQHKSKVLPRIDVAAKISHLEGITPSNHHVKDELAKHFKCDKELVHVEHIYTNYGSGESKIVAYIYNDKKQMNQIITKSSKQREAEKKALEESKKVVVEA